MMIEQPRSRHPVQAASMCARGAVSIDATATFSSLVNFGGSAFSGDNVRSAVVVNSAGDVIATGQTSPYVAYVPFGSSSTITLYRTSGVNPRSAALYNGSLYLTQASGVFLVGTPGAWSSSANQAAVTVLSTTAGYYTGTISVTSFYFASPSSLWICDDSSGGSAGVWQLSGSTGSFAASSNGGATHPFTSPCAGITGQVESGGQLFLYFVSSSSSGSTSLYRLQAGSSTYSRIASSSGGPFRGIARVPVALATPTQTRSWSVTSTCSVSQTLTMSLT